jgi:uncharacterized protein
MTFRFGLKETVILQIREVLVKYPQVEKAVLYGSRASGSYKNGSDIDLTLDGDADLTLKVLFRIMDDLDDLLLPYTFDLSIHHCISDPEVIVQIQREGVMFYKKNESAVKSIAAA